MDTPVIHRFLEAVQSPTAVLDSIALDADDADTRRQLIERATALATAFDTHPPAIQADILKACIPHITITESTLDIDLSPSGLRNLLCPGVGASVETALGGNFSIRPCTVARGCWTPTRASSTVAVHGEGQNHPRSNGQRR